LGVDGPRGIAALSVVEEGFFEPATHDCFLRLCAQFSAVFEGSDLEDDEREWSVPADSWRRVDVAIGDEGEQSVGEGLCDAHVEVGDHDFDAVLALVAEEGVDVALADEVAVLAEVGKQSEDSLQDGDQVVVADYLYLSPSLESGVKDANSLVYGFYVEKYAREHAAFEQLTGDESLVDVDSACFEAGQYFHHVDHLAYFSPIAHCFLPCALLPHHSQHLVD
jgi:hypothetical protein